jgi:hypothetical protein
LLFMTGCLDSKSVELVEVEGSGVTGSADVREAISKAVSYRVDAFVAVDTLGPGMFAAVHEGSCAQPGKLYARVALVHQRGEGGAAEIVHQGRLAELVGYSIHVYAGEPEHSPRLACGDL